MFVRVIRLFFRELIVDVFLLLLGCGEGQEKKSSIDYWIHHDANYEGIDINSKHDWTN